MDEVLSADRHGPGNRTQMIPISQSRT